MISEQIAELKEYSNAMRDTRNDKLSKMIDDAIETIETLSAKVRANNLHGEWISCSERLPEMCGLEVLLTVKNKYGQKFVCKAFTNYMKEGRLMFKTNEKEYCEKSESSMLSEAWMPIAWMPLPEPYKGE